MSAPFPSAERASTVAPIDAALAKDRSPQRILRSRPGRLAVVRSESRMPLFGFAAEDADEDNGSGRLELPKTWGIDELLDPTAIQMEVERFICFQENSDKAVSNVALPAAFCHALNMYTSTAIPTIHGIQTMPMVINRQIVASDGFDEDLGIYFAISHDLRDILPDENECILEAVQREFDWLCDAWLVDVATTRHGKASAIALACTVIARHVLRVKPLFLVRAGQHGTGKTTLLDMVLTAVTGIRTPAAAWSPVEEERRKALFS